MLKIRNLQKFALSLLVLFALSGPAVRAQVHPAEPLAGKQWTTDFITSNLVYPEAALAQGKSGEVVVAFHLDEKGNGSNYRVVESFDEAANACALDLVRKILWSPALDNLLPCPYDIEYAVEFNAKAYRRYWKKHQRVAVPLTHDADTSYIVYELRQLEETAKPYFSDGSNMAQYILSNLEYPESAKAAEIHGTVRLNFVVEADGSISNITVKNSVGGGCDNEAIRLLQQTHWIPAVKNGKYVRSRNAQDITFNIGTRNYQDGNSY